jgi:hypothetical protein
MALLQAERIEISKKIVSIPAENASALDSKDKLQESKVKIKTQDDANKSFVDAKTTPFINGYQNELKRLDGNDRKEVTEQDMFDSATNKAGNFFFPNQITIPTPSIPDGVWKQFVPFANNIAVGKFYNEAYPSTPKEGDIISLIQGYNTSMDAFTGIQRTTGQSCTAGGVNPTPPPPTLPDSIANDPTIQTLATNIITQVNNWRAFLLASIPFIITTDPDSGKQTQNNAAIADINNSISVIDAWLAAPTFDTGHGQTTCAGFNSYNPFLLQATKFRTDIFNTLKAEITARLYFITTRIPQIETNLGSITQGADGTISASSGLYGERFAFINLRLNLMSGTLKRLEGLKLAQRAQDEAINFNNQAALAYASVITATLLKAPSTGIDKLHLMSATGINVSDTVYLVAEDQDELALTVLAKTGDMIQVSQEISQKYRANNLSRIYKVL